MATPASGRCTRRRFLAVGSTATLAALLPLPRRVLAGEQCLLITDDPTVRATDNALLLLRGDRLARLHQLRNHLQTHRPAILRPVLDSTDRVLLDVVLGDIGIVTHLQGDRLYLDYAGNHTARRPA